MYTRDRHFDVQNCGSLLGLNIYYSQFSRQMASFTKYDPRSITQDNPEKLTEDIFDTYYCNISQN